MEGVCIKVSISYEEHDSSVSEVSVISESNACVTITYHLQFRHACSVQNFLSNLIAAAEINSNFALELSNLLHHTP